MTRYLIDSASTARLCKSTELGILQNNFCHASSKAMVKYKVRNYTEHVNFYAPLAEMCEWIGLLQVEEHVLRCAGTCPVFILLIECRRYMSCFMIVTTFSNIQLAIAL